MIIEIRNSNLHTRISARICTRFWSHVLALYQCNTPQHLSLQARPVVVHSREDDFIPSVRGRRLDEAARKLRKFLEIAGGHNDGFLLSMGPYREALEEFIEESD